MTDVKDVVARLRHWLDSNGGVAIRLDDIRAVLDRLEAAERGDIWVAFTRDGMPREVTRQDFEPHVNPRVGQWVRCVRVDGLGGRDE